MPKSDSKVLIDVAARAVVAEIWLHRGYYGLDRETEARQFQHLLTNVQGSMTSDLPEIVYAEFRRILQDAEEEGDAEIEMRGDEVTSKEVEEGKSGDYEGTTGGDPKAGE